LARSSPPPAMILGVPVLPVSLVVALATNIKIVGTGDALLVERLGKFNRQLGPGLHITIPLLERTSFACTTREQVLDIPPQKAITRDNAPLTADAVVYWRITDPELARYAVQDLLAAIQNLVLTQLRSEIGKLTLDETFSARAKMNAVLLEDLDRATDDWGVKVTRVEVRDIIPSKDITQAMEMQMSAERRKRAAVLESEGRRDSQVNDARGAADAVLLQADAESQRLQTVSAGEAASLLKLAEATGGDLDKAMQVLLLSKYWTAQSSIAQSDNTKVLFFPSKATVPDTYEGLRELVSSE
jgi:regulator of protease activity HflC (stomatin/prohibitin superfamily)